MQKFMQKTVNEIYFRVRVVRLTTWAIKVLHLQTCQMGNTFNKQNRTSRNFKHLRMILKAFGFEVTYLVCYEYGFVSPKAVEDV